MAGGARAGLLMIRSGTPIRVAGAVLGLAGHRPALAGLCRPGRQRLRWCPSEPIGPGRRVGLAAEPGRNLRLVAAPVRSLKLVAVPVRSLKLVAVPVRSLGSVAVPVRSLGSGGVPGRSLASTARTGLGRRAGLTGGLVRSAGSTGWTGVAHGPTRETARTSAAALAARLRRCLRDRRRNLPFPVRWTASEQTRGIGVGLGR